MLRHEKCAFTKKFVGVIDPWGLMNAALNLLI